MTNTTTLRVLQSLATHGPQMIPRALPTGRCFQLRLLNRLEREGLITQRRLSAASGSLLMHYTLTTSGAQLLAR